MVKMNRVSGEKQPQLVRFHLLGYSYSPVRKQQ